MDQGWTEEPRTYSVLVVEDDPHTAELLAFNLGQAGFQVFRAENGLDAMKKLQVVAVDIIITDIMMPQMDGFAFREKVLEDNVLRDIPFVFLSAKGTADDQIRGINTGAEEYITKPFDPQVLIARIHGILKRRAHFSRLARRDPLTQLLNRTTTKQEIERELARIKRYPAVATLVFLDLDEFKALNDEYGHAAGDRALIILANSLTKDIRRVDLVGRYGGEEFILYFPETPEAVAKRIVERMHAQFKDASQSEGLRPMTFSAGIAESPRDGTDFDTICARADAAMYQAKRNGKAQVIAWRPTMSEGAAAG